MITKNSSYFTWLVDPKTRRSGGQGRLDTNESTAIVPGAGTCVCRAQGAESRVRGRLTNVMEGTEG